MNKCVSNYSIGDFNELKKFFYENLRINTQFPNRPLEKLVRITKKLAQEMLLNNYTMIIGGQVKWFKLKFLGLGVYQVELNNETEETIYEK